MGRTTPMYKYTTNEAKKINIPSLSLEKLNNEELVGLYLIGHLSYKELQSALDLDDNQVIELINGIQLIISQLILRDDEDSQADAW